MKNIIVIGSRGYNYNYGGWETFVTNLIDNSNKKDKYYVSYLIRDKHELNADRVIKNVTIHDIYIKQAHGTMFFFTKKSVKYYLDYIKQNNLENVVILMLGCKIGPLMKKYLKEFHKLNCQVIINPDGLEWKRDKWPWHIKKYLKLSEKCSIKYSDYVVCDSKEIEKYIKKEYKKYRPRTTFIPYGAYLNTNVDKDKHLEEIFKDYEIKENNYYLVIARFVKENNFETIIKEFMRSDTKKDLVIITNYTMDKYYNELIKKTKFNNDKRIKLVGPIYDANSVMYLRKNAYAYIHGHSAGGTNPSLLESLSLTSINLLYAVGYNYEVGNDACFYFKKDDHSLSKLINKAEKLSKKEINILKEKCITRIKECYTWDKIVNDYSELFDKLIKETSNNN